MRLAFDIESDGLIPEMTVVHSVCLLDIDTGKGWSATDHPGYVSPLGYKVISITEALHMLMNADLVIGHNIIKFDIPAIHKIYSWFKICRTKVYDTLIQSRLIYPEIKDSHFSFRNSHRAKVAARVAEERSAYKAEHDAAFKEVSNYNRLLHYAYEASEDYDEETEPNGLKKEPVYTFDEDASYKKFMNQVLPGQLIGTHGLEGWGYVLGEWKGDYSKDRKAELLEKHHELGKTKPTAEEYSAYVWGTWNIPMQEYCEQDVVVTHKLFLKLDSKGYSERAIEVERDFAWILAEMERNGFPFHMDKALDLQRRLMRRHAELKLELHEAFPPITEYQKFTPKANNSKFGYVKGVEMTKTKVIIFNPGSRDHIAKWLKHKYNWKPKALTPDGKPAVDEKVLKSLPYAEAKKLAEYFLIDKRLGMLEGKAGKGLIPAGRSGRIHGNVNTNGAVTRRCTHTKPNMAQLPATNVPFGKDFRELMYAPPGWFLLGWDASGLELRCFAHYMATFDKGLYRDVVLAGDIHWVHVIALGFFPEGTEYDEHNDEHNHARNKVAKRFIYAYLYGAGPELIGEIIFPDGSTAQKKKEGKRLIAEFLKRTPALKQLKELIKKTTAKRKMHVIGIDGGKMKVRSEHSALNSLLQSSGAIAMKVATILFYDKLIAKGLSPVTDFQLVAHVHDEVQTLVREGLEDIVGETAKEAMLEAGESLGFKCPLEAEWKHGADWAATH